MKKFFIILIVLTITIDCYAQSAEELNNKAKEFLIKKDLDNAFPLLKKAAELGNAESQYNYGVCFQIGEKVIKSDSIANIWFLKSAAAGWKDAQFKIAYSYAVGRGVTTNPNRAFYWSIKCAEQKDVECMYNVIFCYMNGQGTNKNIDSMKVWAIKLASLPNPEDLNISGQITSARLNLAHLYQTGEYWKKNVVQCYSWLLAYNESKHDFSLAEQINNIGFIKSIKNGLTITQQKVALLDAQKNLGHPLRNLEKLYKEEV